MTIAMLEVGRSYQTDNGDEDVPSVTIKAQLLLPSPIHDNQVPDHVVVFQGRGDGNGGIFYFTETGVGIGAFGRKGKHPRVNLTRKIN